MTPLEDALGLAIGISRFFAKGGDELRVAATNALADNAALPSVGAALGGLEEAYPNDLNLGLLRSKYAGITTEEAA